MANVNVGKKKSKRIFYFDALRALAVISVILFHIFNYSKGMVVGDYPFTWNWFFADIMGTVFRCGVDLFLMLSGALSLGRVWDIKSFLGKRLPRITLPFLFWGFVLSLFLAIISITNPDFMNVLDSNNIMGFLNYLYNSYMANNSGFTPYWFFWMILGTYLIMPILNKWLYNAELTEAEYFLGIWLITCIFEYTFMVDFPVTLTYFTGPIGMVVLGYYLRHTEREVFNSPYTSFVIMAIGAILMLLISHMFSTADAFYVFERYNILMVIEVTGIFLFFKNFSKLNIHINFFDNPDGIYKKAIFSIAKYSYGIYLVHRVVLILLGRMFKDVVPYKPLILILFVGSLGISIAVLALLNRVPYVNQVIGAK